MHDYHAGLICRPISHMTLSHHCNSRCTLLCYGLWSLQIQRIWVRSTGGQCASSASNRPHNCLFISHVIQPEWLNASSTAIIPHPTSFANCPFTHCSYPSSLLICITRCFQILHLLTTGVEVTYNAMYCSTEW